MSEKIVKNIPKLRFLEFVNDGEWKKVKLIETANKKIKWSFIGGPFGSNLKASDYTSNGIRVIQLQNIGDGEFQDESKIFTSKQKADELLANNIYPNEIILSKMGDPVARACIIPNHEHRYVMCSDGIRLVVDEKKFSKYFIYTYINSKRFRKLAEETSTGSTRKRIGLSNLKNLPLFIPKKIEEQQKIADCLSSIDSLISVQSQKVELLKEHKKGLLQNLFPKDGESVPKYRFPEFINDGDWEEKEVGDIFQVTRGYVLSMNLVSEKQTKNKSYPVYSSQTKNNGLAGYYSEYLYENAITWTTDGANAGDVNFREGKFYCTNVCGVLLNEEGYANLCIAEIINSVSKNYVSYVGNPKLMNGVMSKIPIQIPSLKEQKKIGNFLTSINEEINLQTQKVESLKEHKKALLQQLFPNQED